MGPVYHLHQRKDAMTPAQLTRTYHHMMLIIKDTKTRQALLRKVCPFYNARTNDTRLPHMGKTSHDADYLKHIIKNAGFSKIYFTPFYNTRTQ